MQAQRLIVQSVLLVIIVDLPPSIQLPMKYGNLADFLRLIFSFLSLLSLGTDLSGFEQIQGNSRVQKVVSVSMDRLHRQYHVCQERFAL